MCVFWQLVRISHNACTHIFVSDSVKWQQSACSFSVALNWSTILGKFGCEMSFNFGNTSSIGTPAKRKCRQKSPSKFPSLRWYGYVRMICFFASISTQPPSGTFHSAHQPLHRHHQPLEQQPFQRKLLLLAQLPVLVQRKAHLEHQVSISQWCANSK